MYMETDAHGSKWSSDHLAVIQVTTFIVCIFFIGHMILKCVQLVNKKYMVGYNYKALYIYQV